MTAKPKQTCFMTEFIYIDL